MLGDPVIAAFLEPLLQRRIRGPESFVSLAAGPHRVVIGPGERLLRFPARAPQRARQAATGTVPARSRHRSSSFFPCQTPTRIAPPREMRQYTREINLVYFYS